MHRVLGSIPEDFDKDIPVTRPEIIIEGYDDKGTICYVVLENIFFGHSIHFDIKRFGPSMLRVMVKEWPSICDTLRFLGVETLCATYVRDDHDKWARFIKYFGFTDPIVVHYANMEL